jgi:hypothetical protein
LELTSSSYLQSNHRAKREEGNGARCKQERIPLEQSVKIGRVLSPQSKQRRSIFRRNQHLFGGSLHDEYGFFPEIERKHTDVGAVEVILVASEWRKVSRHAKTAMLDELEK